MSDYEINRLFGKVYFGLWAIVPLLLVLGLFWNPALGAAAGLFLLLCAIFVVMLFWHTFENPRR